MVDSSVKCNGLSKSNFDVFSKVGQHCLERGFITEAFAWSEIGGEDDVLQLLLIEGIDVRLRGNQRRSRPLAFSMPPFCQDA